MKKFLAFVLALVLMLSCLTACGAGSSNGTDKDTADTQNSADNSGEGRTFTVGFDAEFPPFGFIDANGDYDGFDLAVAQEVCSRLGWTFKAQPIDWNSKDAELKSGNIDCIWNGFTKADNLLDKYCWTEPYYDNSIIMVVKADSGINSLADLAGKNVITQAGSSALTALEENDALTSTFAELLECADYNSAFMELDAGGADAIAADVGVANYNMSKKDGTYKILDEKVSTEVYAIGFRVDDQELADTVWEQVKEIAADGTMKKLADKYVEYGLVVESLSLLNQ